MICLPQSPFVLLALFWKTWLQSGYSYLYLLVAWLLGGYPLQPQSRSGNYPCEDIVEPSRKLDYLVGYRGFGDKAEHLHSKAYPQIVPRQEYTHDNAYDEYYKDKACSAAWMKAGVLFYIFYRKLLAGFITGDGLVFCAVVHKGGLYAAHK